MGVVATILVGWVLIQGATILQPLVIAILLCNVLQPVVRLLRRFYIPSWATVVLLLALLVMGMVRGGELVYAELSAFLRPAQSTPVDVLRAGRPFPPPLDAVHDTFEQQAPVDGEAAGTETPDALAGGPTGPGELGDDTGPATGDESARLEPPQPGDGGGEVAVLDGDAGEAEAAAAEELPPPPASPWGDLKRALEAKIEASDIPWKSQLIELLRSVDLTSEVRNLTGSLAGFFRGVLLVVIYMLFIFAEQNIFRRKIVAVAEPRSDDAERIIDSISLGIQRYLGVKTVISLATGVCCYTALLYLNIPYALLFGFVTFALNYIPTFGSIAASILPISVALARPDGVGDALVVAAVYLGVNITLGTFLEPRLLGRELNLSPLVILVSVVVWAGLWGVAGTFLAVPLTATAQIILANIESTRKIAVLLSNGPMDVLRRMREEAPPVPKGQRAA